MQRASTIAALAVLIAGAWFALNIAFLYGGNATGLFYTGAKAPLPPALGGHTLRVNDEVGYDGQFYHMMAHDPLIRRGFLPYFDNAKLRWRRIGVPGLAALLVAGSDRLVDGVYIGLELAFVALGAFWLSRFAQGGNLHPAWGLAFLLIPAVAVSLDRLTIDLPLAAICIGLALAAERPEAGWEVYAMLASAPLIRETGMLLVAGWCMWRMAARDRLGASLSAAAAVPALVWWAYVQAHTPPDGTPWLSSYPFSGIFLRTLQGTGNPISTPWLRAADVLENVALAGMWLAVLLALYLAIKWRGTFIEITAILFGAFAATMGKFDLWSSAYATGRTLSPLLILLALLAFRGRGELFAAPLLLIVPRIALQYEAQLKLILRGMR